MSLSGGIKKAIGNSSKARYKKRRGRMDIIADILSVAREEAKKTEIVYNANLNFKRVEDGKVHTIVYLFILNMDGSHHRIPQML